MTQRERALEEALNDQRAWLTEIRYGCEDEGVRAKVAVALAAIRAALSAPSEPEVSHARILAEWADEQFDELDLPDEVGHAVEVLLGRAEDEDAAPSGRECTTCRGLGHFRANGKPTDDRRERKCLDCSGVGEVST